MIKLVIFDLDDTLYPEYTYVYQGFMAVCQYLANKYSLDPNLLYQEVLEIYKVFGRGKIFNILCNRYNLQEDIAHLVEVYRNLKPKIQLYNDAELILNALKKRNFNIGIITDGKASVQWNKIEALNLKKYADKIIVTDDHGQENWKPNIYCFKIMLDHFNVKPEESVYIGDNPNKDFIPCNQLNMKSIRLVGTDSVYKEITVDKTLDAEYKLNSIKDILTLDIFNI